MAAGDFTASTIQISQEFLEEIFLGEQPVDAQYKFDPVVARSLFENQSVATNERLEGTDCVGVKAMFLQNEATSITYSGTVDNPGAACALPSGTEASSGSKNYDNNLFIEAQIDVNEKCDNEVDLARETAKAMAKMRVDILKKLNEQATTLLAASVQTNQYTNFDAALLSLGNVGAGPRMEMAKADFTATNSRELKLFALANKLADPMFINGRNFYIDKDLAMFKALSDNQRELNAMYGDLEMYWDIDYSGSSLDNFLRQTTFIVDKNAPLFWNNSWSNPEGDLVNPSLNRYNYTVTDPVYMYRKNGQMVPVTYEVTHEFACASRVRGRELYVHRYFMRLYGGMDVAPTGLNESGSAVFTGVLEIEAV